MRGARALCPLLPSLVVMPLILVPPSGFLYKRRIFVHYEFQHVMRRDMERPTSYHPPSSTYACNWQLAFRWQRSERLNLLPHLGPLLAIGVLASSSAIVVST